MKDIPFNCSSIQGNELAYIEEALASGQVAGDQVFSRKCQKILENAVGTRRALLTTSCTHALEMAALLLDFREGDEVILPDFTFVSTANAFVLRGAKPVFCDIRSDTLNLDERKLEALITPRTKAVVPVHYAGVGCEMDAIIEMCGPRDVAVVEDNAHGLFGKYKGRTLGSFGVLAAQSFHETKNITCGEGGALLINDGTLEQRAEILREKGTNRSKFFRGQVDKYSWVDIGSSYVMSDVLAAFLFGQLEVWPSIQEKRRLLWERYDRELANWAGANGIRRPYVPEYCDQAHHMYYLLMPDSPARDRFIADLGSQGICAVFHYLPLHRSPYVLNLMRSSESEACTCPVSAETSGRLVRLPFYSSMTAAEQDRVIAALLRYQV